MRSYWPTYTPRIHMLSLLSQILSILLVLDGHYFHGVLKGFDFHNKLEERAEHVLRAAEVKYCFECGESRECYGCYQTWCGDSAKVTQCQGHVKAVFSGKLIDGMFNVAYTNDQGCCVPHFQAPVIIGGCASCKN